MLHLGDARGDDRFEIGDQITRRISALRRLGGQRSPNVARLYGRPHGTIFDRDTTVDQPVDQFVSGGAELLGGHGEEPRARTDFRGPERSGRWRDIGRPRSASLRLVRHCGRHHGQIRGHR